MQKSNKFKTDEVRCISVVSEIVGKCFDSSCVKKILSKYPEINILEESESFIKFSCKDQNYIINSDGYGIVSVDIEIDGEVERIISFDWSFSDEHD